MLKRLPIKWFLLFMAIALVGCESTGKIRGVSEGKGVEFEYQQVFFDNHGTLKITMPDGETYTGKFVQNSSSTSGDDWQIGESKDDDALILKGSNTVFSQAEAILIGNRGSTMKCKFRFSAPDAGIDGGGIGSCKTSTGQPINITF